MKECYECKRTLPLDNFYKNRSTKDGLEYSCKDCTKSRIIARNRARLRKCSKCGLEKSKDMFNGKRQTCKECSSIPKTRKPRPMKI